jgi:hypothetical protein
VRMVYALGSPFHSKLLANGECDKHTHTVRINTVMLVDIKCSHVKDSLQHIIR